MKRALAPFKEIENERWKIELEIICLSLNYVKRDNDNLHDFQKIIVSISSDLNSQSPIKNLISSMKELVDGDIKKQNEVLPPPGKWLDT